ncbi:MAG: V-type ATP synthase subunit I [Rubripirellula sp.]
MAIVALDRLTVIGISRQKEAALDGLQGLGCVHLVNLREPTKGPRELVSKEAREALRYLQSCPELRKITTAGSRYERQPLMDEILEIKGDSERLSAERDGLITSIEMLSPWGEFQLPETHEIDHDQFWFYVVPQRQFVEPESEAWSVVKRDNRFAYVVVVASTPPEALAPFAVELDRRPLSQLRQRLASVDEQLDELQWRRVGLTRWRRLLRDDLNAADDKAARLAAAEGMLDDETLFALQGWVPRVATEDVKQFAQQQQLALTVEPAGPDDSAPTLLRNPERVAGAEGCVTFYITPGYHAWDPTTIVFFSFSLFFAMIIADAGYGLMMAGALACFWNKLSKTPKSRRNRNLLIGIISATIMYGAVVGSYFGVEPPPGSILDRVRIRIDGQPMMSNQTAMMLIAVAIGVAHLVLANVISAYQKRSSLRCLGHLGWAMIMLGAFLIGGGMFAEVEMLSTVGKIMAGFGAVFVLCFSSDRRDEGWGLKSTALRLMDGGLQFANLSKAFGDVLSYLRLFALGLASAQLAVTFNGLAADAMSAGGIGLLLAILILIVGHTINFALALLSGVVHGLRLNCIEFFNWSLTEEGYTFQPFRKKAES